MIGVKASSTRALAPALIFSGPRSTSPRRPGVGGSVPGDSVTSPLVLGDAGAVEVGQAVLVADVGLGTRLPVA